MLAVLVAIKKGFANHLACFSIPNFARISMPGYYRIRSGSAPQSNLLLGQSIPASPASPSSRASI
jgi:hypothetical protein